jgi:YggT family protein
VAITVIRILNLLFDVFRYILLARVVFSFVQLGRGANPTLLQIRRYVYWITEPVLAPVRKLVKPVHTGGGMYLDLSPLIVLLLLPFIQTWVIRLALLIL